MTEQEAFEKLFPHPQGGQTVQEVMLEGAIRLGWQARGPYESERTKKLVEALEYIQARSWAGKTPQAGAWINEFCEVAAKALREYKGEPE